MNSPYNNSVTFTTRDDMIPLHILRCQYQSRSLQNLIIADFMDIEEIHIWERLCESQNNKVGEIINPPNAA